MIEKELTNREILDNHEAIFPLAQQEQLPITLKRRIRRIWRLLQPEGQELYGYREELWERYGERDEKGNLVKIFIAGGVMRQAFKTTEDQVIVDREWKKLMAQSHTLQFEPIPYGELEAADQQLQARGLAVAITARQLDVLETAGFITDDAEPAEGEPTG